MSNVEHKLDKVAFSGDKEHGKSTSAKFLESQGFAVDSFAAPLKRFIIDAFQIDPKYVYDPAFKNVVIPSVNVTGRELCQYIGTELMREGLVKCLPNIKLRGGSVWIHSMLEKIDNQYRDKKIVVDDERFDDEYKALKETGFLNIQIYNPRVAKAEFVHKSDLGCPYDVQIVNDSSKEALYDKISNTLVKN